MAIKNILLVCTGNTCRSPLAEAITKKLFSEKLNKKKPSPTIISRGISVYGQEPASVNTLEVLHREYNIDFENHRSTQLTQEDISKADLILCMTSAHVTILNEFFNDTTGKVFTVNQFANQNENFTLDICDPYGRDYFTYKKCGEQLLSELTKIVNRLTEDLK